MKLSNFVFSFNFNIDKVFLVIINKIVILMFLSTKARFSFGRCLFDTLIDWKRTLVWDYGRKEIRVKELVLILSNWRNR